MRYPRCNTENPEGAKFCIQCASPRAVAQAAKRFGGYVAQYLGDGVMAFFGYPEAHDNVAERAARTGLAILEAISKLNQQPERRTRRDRLGCGAKAESEALDKRGTCAKRFDAEPSAPYQDG